MGSRNDRRQNDSLEGDIFPQRSRQKEQEQDLYKAYLNMAPSQTLKWMEAGKGPSEENIEIEGTEPYIVGGHTASGYWVDNNRATT